MGSFAQQDEAPLWQPSQHPPKSVRHVQPASPAEAKLTVSAAGDICEQEADSIADHVMRMPEPQPERACPCGGGCPGCQEARPARVSERLQTDRAAASGSEQTAVPHIVDEVLRSPGQPLNPTIRAFMESRFGHDFSEVQVHTDAQAAESARMIHARAYTVGRNIIFGPGQYSLEDHVGRRLLAHELAHVAQQRAQGPAQSGAQIIRRAPVEPGEKALWVLPDVSTRQAQVDAVVPPGSDSHCQVEAAPKLEPIEGKLHIDIGGEGRYAGAYNLNPSSKGTVPPWAGKPILNHVCGIGENIPVPSGTVDYITLESVPFSQATVSEIARVIKPSGNVRLQSPDTLDNRRWHTRVAQATRLPFEPPKAVDIGGAPALVTRIGNNWESLPLQLE